MTDTERATLAGVYEQLIAIQSRLAASLATADAMQRDLDAERQRSADLSAQLAVAQANIVALNAALLSVQRAQRGECGADVLARFCWN